MVGLIEIFIKLVVLGVVAYLIYILAGALGNTFGIFSALGFVIRSAYSLYTGQAITEPRVIMLIFGFSIISGIAGLIFFDHLIPTIMKGEWLSAIIVVIIIVVFYFSAREKLMEAWENRR